MSGGKGDRPDRSIPRGRLSRLGHFGRLAGGIAGGMAAEGMRRLASGERPQLSDLLLTPGNAMRVADRLSHLRGAALKLGQMMSMDAGDILPPELSTSLATVRNQAYRMPPQQLDAVLKREWGTDWRGRFSHFDATPIAAASIGQVPRAEARRIASGSLGAAVDTAGGMVLGCAANSASLPKIASVSSKAASLYVVIFHVLE